MGKSSIGHFDSVTLLYKEDSDLDQGYRGTYHKRIEGFQNARLHLHQN
jgi:hypothetical protein